MAGKNKYKNFSNYGHAGWHFKKSVLLAAAVLCVAVAAITVFAVRTAGATKKTSSVTPSKVSAQSSSSRSQAKEAVKKTNRVPVLMYHSINHDPKNPNNILRVPKDKFAAEMKWLHDNGYSTLSLDELYDAIANKEQVAEKSVVLTFDDGYGDNYGSAFPVIKQYNFKATVFMITAKIGDSKNGYLTADQLKEMDQNGMRIECHTVDHPDLSTLSYNRQYGELSKSKATLEALLGHPIDYIAYPSGMYNANTIEAAKKIGYKLCFKMKGGVATLSDSQYEFPRIFVGEDLQDFINRVEGTADYSM